jgi:hypothetical protein
LASSIDPLQLGLTKPEGIEDSLWRNLVVAYADAARTDRQARTQFRQQLIITILSALLATALAIPAGMWIERRKKMQST